MSRKREDVERRMIAAVRLRKEGMTIQGIGRKLGGFHHSTVIHWLRQHENLMQFDKQYKTKFEKTI